jgi:hypothetical protein
MAIFLATNRPNAESVAYFRTKYANQVNFYGRLLSKGAVLSDRIAFFQKWPQRNYSLKLETLKIECVTEANCKSNGIVNWNVSGPKLTSLGSASFAFTWTIEHGDWKLSEESSQVISRKVSRSGTNSTTADQPVYYLDKSGSTVVSLSNLYPDRNCSAGKTAGKIVKREFAKDGLKLSGFVIEGPNGSREFINAIVDLDKTDATTKSWVMRGLHTLLTEGRSVEVDVMACGASGRVMMLNAIQ